MARLGLGANPAFEPTATRRLNFALCLNGTLVMDPLEEVWGQREETIYGQLFGDKGKGIYVLDSDIFLKRFKQESLDPRWLHYGIFQCPPNTNRKTWLYVSSGMSNPWGKEPSEYTEEE